MILCIFGIGANCQVMLSNAASSGTPAGNFTSLSLAWGAGIALGVWISENGHINPAVTLAMATWRGFSWKKVPFYILAQILGAIVGGAIVYGNYVHAISLVEGGSTVRTMKTAGLFGTFPMPFVTDVSAFFSEFLGSAMLLFGILMLLDKQNGVPNYFVPVGLFITLFGIGAALGYETGFALNPARDFGPRVVTAMVGYGNQVFTTRSHYWLWSPIIACILGAQVATFLYDLLIYRGNESWVYRTLGRHLHRHSKGESSVSSSPAAV
ncbi:hypothetical protein AGABI2DRAFT_137001 [Agaricus bisporus var. bisporus H97]|uniref:hypothetical protein n=1 Tax=Agaricus bisporus var. bisporus (strain H97 / ATCC MYA-4626 / FGSC 10389) TaxID=936046 RepID=UPI00029F6C3C|nr:hypothetical protein AGABI2DRAFT_137001 [Agaricus bisporus var. bisporus H97]EKV46888.1 hypothetical protein AGABI2DRAFT_137001 [Agaricus bisporus var. bisporus H97]